MENENSQEEALKKKPSKKVVKKKTAQATVLKQLNNQSLYPLQERIGIYVIAVLSTIGLALITYTGVMAVVSSTTLGSDAPADVDVDEIQDMLDDLDYLIGTDEDTDEGTDDVATDVETDVETDEATDEGANEGADDVDTDIETDGGDDDIDTDVPTATPEPTTGTGIINANMVSVWREPGSTALFLVHTGDEITILDLDYDAYWAHVEVETDVFGRETEIGFVRRHFIDVE